MSENRYKSLLFSDPAISCPPIQKVLIRPLVVFSMADNYERRPKNCDFSLGLLFGSIEGSNAVITDAASCEIDAHGNVNDKLKNEIFQNHLLLYPNEKVIGWYSFSSRPIDYAPAIGINSNGVHIWMKPTSPPLISTSCVLKVADGSLVYRPTEYCIEATAPEQVALSRVADSSSSGSLQAAINELIELLSKMQSLCTEKKGFGKDKYIARQIHQALSNTRLSSASKEALESTVTHIKSFVDMLDLADKEIFRSEQIQTEQFLQ